ncbi:MAG: aminotransferase class I/II-fold pyridoxal phosphate-dependent enzyme [Pseudomonadota bacterium]
MANHAEYHPATIAAQAASACDRATGGIVPAIHMATTFARQPDYALKNTQNSYLRADSENVRIAEKVLAQLECGADCLLFSAGMAAVAAMLQTVPTGGCVLKQTQIYYGTGVWFERFCARRNIRLIEFDPADSESRAQLMVDCRPNLVWIETPSNPWLRVTDIAANARDAHAVQAMLVVDSTTATPIISQPLNLGADIVMHSATKGINGHSDVLAGALVARAPESPVWKTLRADRDMAGAVLGPMDAWLLTRGMRTLPLRARKMSENALTLANYLAEHPAVETVFYPGLPTHPHHDLARAQMTGGFGGLLSFILKGGAERALQVAGRLQLFHRATSLGGVESLIEHRQTIEPHSDIPEGLLRISAGIEDARDLLSDLDQALRV